MHSTAGQQCGHQMTSSNAIQHHNAATKTLCGSCGCCYVVPVDVNHASGSLQLHGTKHKAVPVQLKYSRPDESMHLRLVTKEAGPDGCVLVFEAQTASDASLHPIPGRHQRDS
jgi:hypothetical protein